ncbi:hypothetical protein AKJ35_01460 [candidate division MSBL1 archaeon SCGC-AAA833F18]|uniref:Phosphomevalonate dehydratase small subunit n=3 Tax=candidate division MSBL1 TaxID=215777 RepID=A0A133V2H3_9EURY|nr:hypothetical protein AKJ42_00225 [candidate division MSBL1 archaeon SCGC-AAA261C02]KXB04981.1 hypothetical protein AKJ48_00600 [candidate division MSBL1 archaeon SCGC-AAA261O19]KXB09053.1 hypothetical protein AKJ35_01460 [candidate division MSBL1 archaeon SCGC-AAA833F18]
MKLHGCVVKEGEGKGRALVSDKPISFLGGLDPKTGKITEPDHDLEGGSVKDRILVFPHGKGSTVGSYVLYQLAQNGNAPAGIINREAEPIVAVGAIISEIPMVHKLDKDPIKSIKTGDLVIIKGESVLVEGE